MRIYRVEVIVPEKLTSEGFEARRQFFVTKELMEKLVADCVADGYQTMTVPVNLMDEQEHLDNSIKNFKRQIGALTVEVK